jgi:hypothetical protein
LKRCLEAADLGRSLADKHLLARALTEAAWASVLGFGASDEEAQRLCSEGLRLAAELDDRWLIAYGTFCKGSLSSGADARLLIEDARRRFRDLGDVFHQARSVGNLGFILLSEGETDEAGHYLTESVALAEEIGDALLLATAGTDLAACHVLAGDLPPAAERLGRAVETFLRIRTRRFATSAVVVAAAMAEQAGHREAGLRLAGAADRLIELAESSYDDVEKRLLTAARLRSPRTDAEQALIASGGTLDFDEALDEALAIVARVERSPAPVI